MLNAAPDKVKLPISDVELLITAATTSIELQKKVEELEKQAGKQYGIGVSAGKVEALKYTPQERENYGKWVALAEEHHKLKDQLTQSLAREAEYKTLLDKIGFYCAGNALTLQESENIAKLVIEALKDNPTQSFVSTSDQLLVEMVAALEELTRTCKTCEGGGQDLDGSMGVDEPCIDCGHAVSIVKEAKKRNIGQKGNENEM